MARLRTVISTRIVETGFSLVRESRVYLFQHRSHFGLPALQTLTSDLLPRIFDDFAFAQTHAYDLNPQIFRVTSHQSRLRLRQ